MSYIEWSAVRSVWFTQYQSLGQTKVVRALFENPGLYNHGNGLLVYTGIDPDDQTQRVLVSYQLYEHLRLSLEAVLQRLNKGLPPPRGLSPSRIAWTEITETYVKSSKELDKLNQKCKKESKRLQRMQNARNQVDHALSLVQAKKYVFFSIDIEAYELDHSILLEIGWTLYDSRKEVLQDQHYINNTYRHLTNGRYVEDQRLSFDFGTSVWCTLDQALAELQADLEWAVKRDGGYVLVGHNLDSDIVYLRDAKFQWPCKDGYTTLDVQESAAVAILNTDSMYGVYRNDLHNPPSLSGTLNELGIEHWHMHNAGNDAHYTMLLFLQLIKKFKDANDNVKCELIHLL